LWPAQAAHLKGQVSTRRLGNSDLNITPVGFGAWAIGGRLRLCLGQPDSIAAVHRSLDLGVNWIDTAPVYGTGHSEEIVASALKEWRRSRPYVFTKCVMRWDEKGRVTTVFNCDSMRRECHDSLRRLHVDAIDFYQMHWPPADNGPGLEEAWQTNAGHPSARPRERINFEEGAERLFR
jgi:aryl-alcohol dehydrogenase-like predicted oxidoreductase